MSEETEVWYVRLADGSVHPTTLDGIDSAFNAGSIDADVLVALAGEKEWKRLGELAGLDEEPAPSFGVVSVPAYTASMTPPASVIPTSLRPVNFDLDDDEEPAFRPKSRKKTVFATFVALAAVGGIAFAATHPGTLRNFSNFRTSSVAAAAPPAPPPAVVTPDPVAVAAPPTAPPTAAAATPPPADQAGSRFSDEQKQKLLAADKARDDESKARRAKIQGNSVNSLHHSSRPTRSMGFTSGGNKYDPLNANL
jgi:hypothetical protein